MTDNKEQGRILLLVLLGMVMILVVYSVPGPDHGRQNMKLSTKAHTKSGSIGMAEEPGHKTPEVQAHTDPKPSDKPEHSTVAEKQPEKAAQAKDEKEPAPVAEKTTDAPQGGQLPDVIEMNNPGYAKHKKGIVVFTHNKHIDTYGISCGQCHHDDKGQPLELSASDPVDGCISCHTETEKPKGEKLDKKAKIAKYHFEAIHANCIDCHKSYNIEKGDPKGKKPAPISCSQCHPKN